jgi:hypothetical protein
VGKPAFFRCRLERKKREKDEQVAYKLEQEIALWDPNSNEESTTDPFKTLFVGRINYYTSESKLRREFESYGPIKQIKMIHNKETGKPLGYCFIEYEHEKDMHCEYIGGNHFFFFLFLKPFGSKNEKATARCKWLGSSFCSFLI